MNACLQLHLYQHDQEMTDGALYNIIRLYEFYDDKLGDIERGMKTYIARYKEETE